MWQPSVLMRVMCQRERCVAARYGSEAFERVLSQAVCALHSITASLEPELTKSTDEFSCALPDAVSWVAAGAGMSVREAGRNQEQHLQEGGETFNIHGRLSELKQGVELPCCVRGSQS